MTTRLAALTDAILAIQSSCSLSNATNPARTYYLGAPDDYETFTRAEMRAHHPELLDLIDTNERRKEKEAERAS